MKKPTKLLNSKEIIISHGSYCKKEKFMAGDIIGHRFNHSTKEIDTVFYYD